MKLWIKTCILTKQKRRAYNAAQCAVIICTPKLGYLKQYFDILELERRTAMQWVDRMNSAMEI